MLLRTALFLLLLPLLSFGQQSEINQKLDTFLTIAEDLFNKTKLPGAGITIVYDGEVIYKGGFGYSNLEQKKPITENTVFFIGSTTKAFTGFLAAKLVDKQLIDWKRPIINYLPEFTLSEPYVAKHVNLEDLFTHMTGLARKDELWHGKPLSRDQVYQQTATLPFTNSFRGGWEYNNHAYVIIGKVLETVTGKTWESLIQEEVYAPLGMTNSHVTYQSFLQDEHHVTGYYEDGTTEWPHINFENIAPAGMIGSTPNDISKWLQMLVNKGVYEGKPLVAKETFDYLINPKGMSFTDTCTVKYYSIGWGGKKTENRRTLRHSGAITGNSARVSIMPDDGFGIFVMTNQRSDYKSILTDYAESIFVNGDFKRDASWENEVISLNRFTQFQNTLLNLGIEAARDYHATLKYKDFEANMIRLGEALMESDYIEPALFVFELNTKDHPNSYRAYNNYAAALLKNKDTKNAIAMYKKSLEINADNPTAKMALEKLKNGK